MIIRLLILLCFAIFLAGGVTLALNVQGNVTVEAFGEIYSTPSYAAILAFVLGLGAIIGVTWFFVSARQFPKNFKARRERDRLERGVSALSRGLEAVAVGEADDAKHHARIARRNLGEGSATRLLLAQAAQLSGDDAAARDAYAAMLEAPETEYLGLRGLHGEALKQGNDEEARQFAERAYKLRPKAAWAFQTVFDLAIDRGAWQEAQEVLSAARKQKSLDADAANRAEAAILSASAAETEAAGDEKAAADLVDKALKRDKSFAPAAVVASRLYQANGNRARAEKVLTTAYKAAPHETLAYAFLDLLDTDGQAEPAAVSARLQEFANLGGASRTSTFLKAKAEVMAGDFETALETLEPYLVEHADAADCALMADAVSGARSPAAARAWQEMAASRPGRAFAFENRHFRLSTAAWANVIREYMHSGQLSAPMLIEASHGVPMADIRLLTAAPDLEEQSEHPVAELEDQRADETDEIIREPEGPEAALPTPESDSQPQAETNFSAEEDEPPTRPTSPEAPLQDAEPLREESSVDAEDTLDKDQSLPEAPPETDAKAELGEEMEAKAEPNQKPATDGNDQTHTTNQQIQDDTDKEVTPSNSAEPDGTQDPRQPSD
ncbi:MAG: heme biosynthesis HemY N-terminal domain-containing protein [Pseudomonadota bacterium]